MPSPSVAPLAKPRRLLIVDDEPLFVAALVRSLKRSYALVTASSVDEALQVIQRGSDFDAVLCDIRMPGRPGPELHAELRAALPGLARRFIWITASPGTLASVAKGAAVLAKPLSMEELRSAIEEILSND